jgi:hypothetical protein
MSRLLDNQIIFSKEFHGIQNHFHGGNIAYLSF